MTLCPEFFKPSRATMHPIVVSQACNSSSTASLQLVQEEPASVTEVQEVPEACTEACTFAQTFWCFCFRVGDVIVGFTNRAVGVIGDWELEKDKNLRGPGIWLPSALKLKQIGC